MGYRGNIRIVLTESGFEELAQKMAITYPENTLLKYLDVNVHANGQVFFGWNDIKYGNEVCDLRHSLDDLNDHAYSFVWMGEDYDDIETHEGFSATEEITSATCSIVRQFDSVFWEECSR